ncbi:MAG: hypothetical protein KDN05_05040 [Verrucomicrobiae bacterium]|nr:hypothetical protein [Verrucomicrobiae bacterium]
MDGILHELAKLYQGSAAGRKGALRDFTIDYETFLRRAGRADGDEREMAERELAAAASRSEGMLAIDRQPRTGMPTLLRLSRTGGEEWLFREIGTPPPSECRRELAAFFSEQQSADVPEQWRSPWAGWLAEMSDKALSGESIQPFNRGDDEANHALMHALAGVLNWRRPSLIRYASTAICGDSKQLQQLESRLRVALHNITGNDSLEAFGIYRKPRSITFHGPLELKLNGGTIDFAPFPAAVTLSELNLIPSAQLRTSARLCLTVENEDTFHELAATNPGVLLILTSYPGSGVLRLIRMLPDELPFHHFGDSDPAGSDILRDLREKTGRTITPLLIEGAPSSRHAQQALGDQDIRIIERLLAMPEQADLHPRLSAILNAGSKGSFEQEAVPIDEVWKALGFA